MRVNKILRENSDYPVQAFAKIDEEFGFANLTHEETIRCTKVACKFIQDCKKMRSYSKKWIANEIDVRKIRAKLRERLVEIEAMELAQLESEKVFEETVAIFSPRGTAS